MQSKVLEQLMKKNNISSLLKDQSNIAEYEEALLELAQNQADIQDALLELAKLIGGK